MKKILTTIIIVALASLSLNADVKLGKCTIYVNDGAPESVKTAAAELKKYIALATGNELAITNRPSPEMIALGDSPELRAAGLDPDEFAYEEFRILVKGGIIYIAGRDLPNDGKTPLGGHSFGTLYGTYDFLETILGISWLLPNEKGDYVPSLGKDYCVKDMDVTFKPQLNYRVIGMDNRFYWKWVTRNRMFGERHEAVADHFWEPLYPEPAHPNSKFLKDRYTTFKENPEFFEMASNGKRMYPNGHFSLCISNPKVIEDISERILKFAEQTKSKIISIVPNDATPRCECRECLRTVVPLTAEMTGKLSLDQSGSKCWTKPVMEYYRKVAETVKAKNPDLILSGAVYQHYEFRPDNDLKALPDNFSTVMAGSWTAYGPVRLYEPINQSWKRWFDSWKGIFAMQDYYGVDFWLRQSAGIPMSPYPQMLKETFGAMREAKFKGAYFYRNDGFGANAPYMWMVMQLMWRPDRDPFKLMDEFMVKAYGEKAAPHIKKLYELAERKMREHIVLREGRSGYNFNPEMANEVYASEWKEYERLYCAALNEPKDENQKWRLYVLGENLRLLAYHLDNMGMISQDPKSPLFMDDKGFQELNSRRTLSNQELYGLLPYQALSDYIKGATIAVNVIPEIKIPNAEPMQETFYQLHRDFIVYAPESGTAVFELEYKTDPNPFTKQPYLPEIGYFIVRNLDNAGEYSGIAKQGRIAFPVEKGKSYYLFYVPLMEYCSGVRWHIKSANVPYAIGQRIHPNGIAVVDAKTPLYFKVPENVKSFKLYFQGTRFKAEICAPDNSIVKKLKTGSYEAVEINDPSSGWWKIRFIGNCNGFVRQGEELSGFFVDNPEKGLEIIRQ